MFNYIKYILSVPKKLILTWVLAPAIYLCLLPLAFANESVQSILIDTQRDAFSGMSENEGLMNFLGISDWDNVFTLEGMVTTYFMNLFVPILVAISTIVLLNKMSAKAEEDGTFEFVASLPMTRGTIYLAHSIVAVMFGIFISQTWFHIMYIPMATMNLSQTMDYAPMIQAGFQSALGGVSYGVVGFSIAAYTGKSSNGWTFGMGLLGIEWISNMLSRTNDIFLWIDENISSFGAYGNPYKDGLDTGDITLVVAKIFIFLVIGFIGFRNRSLNLR